jgi:hypothetical protein
MAPVYNRGMSNNNFWLGFLASRYSRLKREEMAQKNKFGVADELKKLSDLLKEGVITQAEFDQQRKKLLG